MSPTVTSIVALTFARLTFETTVDTKFVDALTSRPLFCDAATRRECVRQVANDGARGFLVFGVQCRTARKGGNGFSQVDAFSLGDLYQLVAREHVPSSLHSFAVMLFNSVAWQAKNLYRFVDCVLGGLHFPLRMKLASSVLLMNTALPWR